MGKSVFSTQTLECLKVKLNIQSWIFCFLFSLSEINGNL